jgi:hypothetical protein
VSLLVVGGEEERDLMELGRYTMAAGNPVQTLRGAMMGGSEGRDRSTPSPFRSSASSVARAAALIADAVVRDRRRVLCCGVQAEAARGLPAIFATIPAIIGRHGREEIFPAPLTIEERSFLQRFAGA